MLKVQTGKTVRSAGSVLFAAALAISMTPPVAYAEDAFESQIPELAQDQSEPSAEEVEAAIASGDLSISDDSAATFQEEGLVQPRAARSCSFPVKTNTKVPSSVRSFDYSGADMFETAAAEAEAAYPDGVSSAILVGPGDSWIDALASAGLAASKGPILFTEWGGLSDAARVAMRELGVKSVLIMGGTAAVSADVEADLAQEGIALEARLGGEDCFGTQLAIYEYGKKNGFWSGDSVLYATAGWFGDALSASPLAFAARSPIFLVNSRKELNYQQKVALESAAQEGFGRRAIILGGTAVVSDATERYAAGVSARAGGADQAVRLAGDDQYGTSIAIANYEAASGFTWNNVAFASGDLPYDALAGSVFQGKTAAPLLLVHDYDTSTIAAVGSHKADIDRVRFFGGEAAVSMQTRMGVSDALGYPWAANYGFKVYVDAGHGPDGVTPGVYDPGAIANGYRESDLTKELAGMVDKILREEYGVATFLNVDGGNYRFRMPEALANGSDAFVSIHFNSSGASGPSGVESYIHSYNASRFSAAWQGMIHPRLVEGVGLADRGQRKAELAVVGGGRIPSVLLEVAYINNASDMAQYQTRKHVVAHKIAEGMVA